MRRGKRKKEEVRGLETKGKNEEEAKGRHQKEKVESKGQLSVRGIKG